MMKPSAADLERARAWLVQAFGVLPPGAELRIESLAREFASVRGTLDELAKMQTEALVEAEWDRYLDGGRWHRRCPACQAWASPDAPLNLARHGDGCPVDAALTAAGLPTQELRDAMRKELAKR